MVLIGVMVNHKIKTSQYSSNYVFDILHSKMDSIEVWLLKGMTKAGRVVLVQFVLTAMPVYILIAIDLPAWALKAHDKIRRGFVWQGRKDAQGGHCLIAWPKVCRSKELGALGFSDLKALGYALRVRWPWFKMVDPNKPWANLPLQVSKEVASLLEIAVYTELAME